MASGFGYTGGRSRCFTFWQDFQKCYASADEPSQCAPQKADYMECLHHTEELKRAETLKTHFMHQLLKEQADAREKGKERAAGAPVRLGLIVDDKPTPPSDKGSGGDAGGEKAEKDDK